MSRNAFVDFKAVKAAISMLQILDRYGLTDRFKRNGDNLTGPCPIHDGQNPTQFRVSLEKNCWNCFGKCKGGGNVLDFVARMEGDTPREAALRICEWFSLPLVTIGQPSSDRPKESEPSPKRRASQIVELDNEPNKPLGFELKNLDPTHPFFTERGIMPQAISHFGLGLCPKGSMAERIVIPIHNDAGELVAYAGRWPGAPSEECPKYRFPPAFRKSLEVFNAHRARNESTAQPLLIVKGFFGCVDLWQRGLSRVVSLMGTALSPQQEEIILALTEQDGRIVVMLGDGEEADAPQEKIVCRLSRKRFIRALSFPRDDQPFAELAALASL